MASSKKKVNKTKRKQTTLRRIIGSIVSISMVIVIFYFLDYGGIFSLTSSSSSSSSSSSTSSSGSSTSLNLVENNSTLGEISNPFINESCPIMETYFIEMVQQYGDAILIKCGNFEMLIDAGQSSDGPNVKSILDDKVEDGVLDLLVITHPHSDHYGGITTALLGIEKINYILDFGYTRSSNVDYIKYNALRENYVSKGAKYCPALYAIREEYNCNDHIYISSDTYIDVLDTKLYKDPSYVASSSFDFNGSSIAFLLHHKDVDYYYSGDLEETGEKNILGQVGEVDLMKATHHGTNSGNTKELLDFLNPEYVIISTSAYPSKISSEEQHPYQEALNRIYSSSRIKDNFNVYLNMTMGTIKVIDDGSSITSLEGSEELWGGYEIDGVKITKESNLKLHETAWFKAYRTLPSA